MATRRTTVRRSTSRRRAAPRASAIASPPAAHATRERILRVAADAWHARSFDGIGTAEICRRAKVHKGSFFHFFATKEQLLLAVLDRYARDMDASLRAGPFKPDVAPLARFERFFAGLGDHFRDQMAREGAFRGCPIGNVVIELSTRDAKARAAAARVFDAMRALFAETFEEAVRRGELPAATDARAAADAALAVLQGIAVLGKAYGDEALLEGVAARAVRWIRTGAPAA